MPKYPKTQLQLQISMDRLTFESFKLFLVVEQGDAHPLSMCPAMLPREHWVKEQMHRGKW